MRQYPSNGGVLDSSELDPCLAAETRMKHSVISSKMKKLIIFLGVLCMLLLLLGLFFFILGNRSDDSIDYEEHEVQMDSLPARKEEETFVKQTLPPPIFITDPPTTPSPRFSRLRTTSKPATTQRLPKLIPVEVISTATSSTTSTTTTSSTTTAPTTESTTSTTRPTTTEAPTTPQPTVSVRVSYMQVQPSVIPITNVVRSDCMDHLDVGMGSGIYLINPDGGEAFHVFCDMETDGGGWTVIQRRLNGDIPFYNYTYQEYEDGFGDLRSSHWLGLNYMHRLAPSGYSPLTLRIELRGDTCPECSGQPNGLWWGEWDFALGPPSSFYRLEISEHQLRGNLSNPQTGGKGRWEEISNGRPFTTMDVDNDISPLNCAQFRSMGGWWHRDCSRMSLNGKYGDDARKYRYLVYIYDPPKKPGQRSAESYIHPRQTLMMVRPKPSLQV